KQLARGGEQLLASADVGEQRRAREEERSAPRKLERTHCRRRAGRIAVRHHHAERAQAIERLHESVLAHRVVHHGDAGVPGELPDTRYEVVPPGDEHMAATMLPREFRLLVIADHADDSRPESIRPLAE